MQVVLKSLLLIFLFSQVFSAHAQDAVSEQIRKHSESMLQNEGGVVSGQKIAAVTVLPEFYAARGYRPAWSDPARFQEVLKVLQGSESHGLNPEDYHYPMLVASSGVSSPDQLAARDVLATDALIRFGYHLQFGKIDPTRLDPDWNLTRKLSNRDPAEMVAQAVASPDLDRFLTDNLGPDGSFYNGLRKALARYRKLAAAGGWPTVADGPTLKPDDRNERVAALRARLAVTDSALQTSVTDPGLFDAELVAAVERFQMKHGLDEDGVVGARTTEELNVSAEQRVEQLKVNLERTRWVFRDLKPRFLVVNIAGFEVYLVEDSKIVWNSRVQVGKPYRKTPVFKKEMTYLVLSPTWTVPPTILKKDIIPKIKKNPAYLTDNNMVLLDRSGNKVDISRIDLATISPNNFPYTVRQEPGPKNALGRIKFMFPNKHFVYLHDTPSRSLFNKAERTTSSGCIRVEKPISLAAELLGDPVNWSEAKVEERISKASNETVKLNNPITVFLIYWTSVPDGDGDVRFFSDVYSRDQAVLEGLRRPFEFREVR